MRPLLPTYRVAPTVQFDPGCNVSTSDESLGVVPLPLDLISSKSIPSTVTLTLLSPSLLRIYEQCGENSAHWATYSDSDVTATVSSLAEIGKEITSPSFGLNEIRKRQSFNMNIRPHWIAAPCTTRVTDNRRKMRKQTTMLSLPM